MRKHDIYCTFISTVYLFWFGFFLYKTFVWHIKKTISFPGMRFGILSSPPPLLSDYRRVSVSLFWFLFFLFFLHGIDSQLLFWSRSLIEVNYSFFRSSLPRTVTVTTTTTNVSSHNNSSHDIQFQMQNMSCPPPPPPPSRSNIPPQTSIPLPVYYHSAEATYGTYRYCILSPSTYF